MNAAAIAGVRTDYRHEVKAIAPGPGLRLGERAILKWYDIAAPSTPVPEAIRALARENLVEAFTEGALDIDGLGFVILHRCGEAFYFLLVTTWVGDNELWETVWAKADSDETSFRPWQAGGSHRPTFCVWELGAVWHEQQAWSRFLRSARGATACEAYLGDSYRGTA